MCSINISSIIEKSIKIIEIIKFSFTLFMIVFQNIMKFNKLYYISQLKIIQYR